MRNQQIAHLFSYNNDHSSSIYAKNPRYKLQKLMKSKIVQLNQKCLLTKCLAQQNDQVVIIENKNKQPASGSFRYHQRNRRGYQTQRKQILKQSRRLIDSQTNIQTIDTMKQKISQTLLRDLVSLQNLQKELVHTNNKKNAVKIKLMSSRRRSLTINYNQCCSLAQQKFEDELLIHGVHEGPDSTPKLNIHQNQRCKTIAPMMFIHKKKQLKRYHFEERQDNNFQQQLSDSIIIKKKGNVVCSSRKSGHNNKHTIQQNLGRHRRQQFSPWQINSKTQLNPQIGDFLSSQMGRN